MAGRFDAGNSQWQEKATASESFSTLPTLGKSNKLGHRVSDTIGLL